MGNNPSVVLTSAQQPQPQQLPLIQQQQNPIMQFSVPTQELPSQLAQLVQQQQQQQQQQISLPQHPEAILQQPKVAPSLQQPKPLIVLQQQQQLKQQQPPSSSSSLAPPLQVMEQMEHLKISTQQQQQQQQQLSLPLSSPLPLPSVQGILEDTKPFTSVLENFLAGSI